MQRSNDANADSFDRLLTSINSRLDMTSSDTNTELLKAYINELAKSVDDDFYDDGYREMYWEETEKYPSATIKLEELKKIKWNLIHMIDASDIAFKTIPEKPEKIFYIKMEGKE